jgi:hypothetical protein
MTLTLAECTWRKKCKIIPFFHAGCWPISSLNSKSKYAAYLHSFGMWRAYQYCAFLFGLATATRDELADIGTKALVQLYEWNPKTDSLNLLRHNLYWKKSQLVKANLILQISTYRKCCCSSYLTRALTMPYWKTMNTNADDPEEWDWKKLQTNCNL